MILGCGGIYFPLHLIQRPQKSLPWISTDERFRGFTMQEFGNVSLKGLKF